MAAFVRSGVNTVKPTSSERGTKRKPIRVLLAKVGLDGHDLGILIVARRLQEAGMEVIYTGLHQSPENVAVAAIQENVDIVGISSLADAHRELAPIVVNLLREQGSNIPVVLGGFIQPEDVSELKKAGIAEVFAINATLDVAVNSIERIAG